MTKEDILFFVGIFSVVIGFSVSFVGLYTENLRLILSGVCLMWAVWLFIKIYCK